jgi:hypothetical protein
MGTLVSSALAATFTLQLSAPSSAVVGHPFVIQATGTDPTDQGALYLEIDLIPASVTTTCPSGYLTASQLATSTGGDLVAFDQRETFDSAGNFSMPVGYTPKAPGQVLLCGYTDDGATDTLATASTIVNIQRASAKPTNVTKPHITRSGNHLTCKHGSWSNKPSSYSYRWLVKGKAKKGARGRKLRVTGRLRGDKVRCKVAAANASGTTTAVSAPVRIR